MLLVDEEFPRAGQRSNRIVEHETNQAHVTQARLKEESAGCQLKPHSFEQREAGDASHAGLHGADIHPLAEATISRS